MANNTVWIMALTGSAVLHLSAFSSSQWMPMFALPELPDKGPNMEIEFELFQPNPVPIIAIPQEEIKEAAPPIDTLASILDALESAPEPELSIETPESIPLTEEVTSDTIKTLMDLDKEELQKMAWDYGNRVGSLIKKNWKLPAYMAENPSWDLELVVIEITLNQQRRLILGTPKIRKGYASSFPEINQAALAAVYKSVAQFPPLPERYDRETISFAVPIRLERKK